MTIVYKMPKASDVINALDIKDTSKKLYLSQLSKLNDGKEPTNYKFLQDTEAIEKKLEKYSDNSKRTFYVAIISYLPEKNTARKYYYDKMMAVNKASREKAGEKTEKQVENWMSQEEVMAVWEKLKAEAEPILRKKKVSDDETKILESYVILSLYVLQPPRRSLDYTQMVVVPKYDENMDKAFNYLSLKDKKFYFNNYKTAGTYKTQIEDIPEDLFAILKKYRKEGLLLQSDGRAVTSPEMTYKLNKIFGKKISVSMLRSIFISSKHSDGAKELEKDVKMMGTSVSTARQSYIKTD
jgi:hypothetical protein